MKVKLFNGSLTTLNAQIISGGYDQETSRATVMIRDGDAAGTITLDVNEAKRLIAILSSGLPDVQRVEVPSAEFSKEYAAQVR